MLFTEFSWRETHSNTTAAADGAHPCGGGVGSIKQYAEANCIDRDIFCERLRNALGDILNDEELPIELFEGAKNIRLPEHKPAYPKSINKEP